MKGIHCPAHPTAPLHVTTVRRVAIGIVRRYRACSVEGCAYRVRTEERVQPAGGCRPAKKSPGS
jgi:hypothetical protein